MLKVKTYVDKSSVHGIGLFADQFIPKGTTTWEFEPGFDICFSTEMVNSFPEVTQKYLYYYAYFDKDLNQFVLCSDHLKFINHSTSKPNITSTTRKDVAGVDILQGQELLCNYNLFDDGYFLRMGLSDSDLVD